MESVQPQVTNNTLIIEKVALHTLCAGRKLIKTIGPLELIEKDGVLWIRVNHWYNQQVFKTSQFYKIANEHYIAYIFENIAGGFYAISIPQNDSNLKTFEQRISTVAKISEYAQGLKIGDFSQKIKYHYPQIENSPIHTDDLFTPLFALGGKVQSTVGQNFKQDLKNQPLATKTKNFFRSGWDKIKYGFKKVDEKTDAIPGVRATKDFVSNTTDKIVQTGKKVAQKVTGNNKDAPVPVVQEAPSTN